MTEDLPALLDRVERLTREAATTLGQPMLDAASTAAQIGYIGRLAGGGFMLVVVIAIAILYWLAWRATGTWKEAEHPQKCREVLGAIAAVIAVPTLLVALTLLLDFRNWVAAFDGRVALALKLLN